MTGYTSRVAWTLDELREQLAEGGVSHVAIDRARALLWIVDRQRERIADLEAENARLRAVLRQAGDIWLAINRSEPNPDAIYPSLKKVAAAMSDEIDAALERKEPPR